MISVVATLVFFVLLFHAFYYSIPGKTSNYPTSRVIILKRQLLADRKLVVKNVNLKKTSIILTLISSDTLLGMATPGQIGFQTPATPIMEGLIDLHHDIMFFLTFIIIFVFYLLVTIMYLFNEHRSSNRNTSTVTHHT
jgi:hypothetical protein